MDTVTILGRRGKVDWDFDAYILGRREQLLSRRALACDVSDKHLERNSFTWERSCLRFVIILRRLIINRHKMQDGHVMTKSMCDAKKTL
jgi:hypothetical protein